MLGKMISFINSLDWMIVILIGIFTLVAWSLHRAHKDPKNSINVVDLVLENGRISRIGFAFMTTLIFSLWFMIELETKGRMTEGYFTIFCTAWIAPIVAKLFSPNGAAKPLVSNPPQLPGVF